MYEKVEMPPPGVPAIFVLVMVASLVRCGAEWFQPWAERKQASGTVQQRILAHCVVVFAVALTFWLWAVLKVAVYRDKDLGVISFLGALGASVLTYYATLHSQVSQNSLPLIRMQRWVMYSVCTLVSINYFVVLATMPALPATFQLYLIVGGLYWTGLSCVGWHLINQLVKALDESETGQYQVSVDGVIFYGEQNVGSDTEPLMER